MPVKRGIRRKLTWTRKGKYIRSHIPVGAELRRLYHIKARDKVLVDYYDIYHKLNGLMMAIDRAERDILEKKLFSDTMHNTKVEIEYFPSAGLTQDEKKTLLNFAERAQRGIDQNDIDAAIMFTNFLRRSLVDSVLNKPSIIVGETRYLPVEKFRGL